MAEIAVNFIAWHEFTHIGNGHLDFKEARWGRLLIQEIASFEADTSYAMISQAWEMDADQMAIGKQLRNTLETIDNYSSCKEPMRGFFQSKKAALALCLLACDTVFKLLDNGQGIQSPWTNLDHPPLDNRRRLLILGVRERLQKWGRQELLDTMPDFNNFVMYINDNLSEALFGRRADHDTLSKAYGKEGHDHFEQILRTWSAIKDEMQVFSSFELAPAQFPIESSPAA
jgi:hypothetical protein